MRQEIIKREGTYNSLKLTTKATPILQGDEHIYGIIQKKNQQPTASSKSSVQALDYSRPLFDLLKQKRTALSKEKGVPPYVIFPDKTLIELAYYVPQNSSRLPTIHGIGQVKAEKYGDEFLPIIRSFCRKNGMKEKLKETSSTQKITPKSLRKNSRAHQVGTLFNEGKSISQIADHFDVKEQSVLANIAKFVKAGHRVPSKRILALSPLSKAKRTHVINAFGEHGTEMLRPVYKALNEDVSYDNLRIIQLALIAHD